MKNLFRNFAVLFAAVCFTAVGLFGEKTAAQTKKNARTAATPKTKKSPTATVKTTARTKSKPPSKSPVKSKAAKTSGKPKTAKQKDNSGTAINSKPAISSKPASSTPKSSGGQIIVIVAAPRIRRQPKTNSMQVGSVKIGKILPVVERNGDWYRVEYADGKSGWISNTLVKNYEVDERDKVYMEIANRYFKQKSIDLAIATEVLEFLRTAQALVNSDSQKAELNLKRLRILSLALKAIPTGKSEQFPYNNFLKSNEKEIVYSDPSGEWFVRSDILWDLRERFARLPVAEDIAWDAAQNPIPGECEGYVNCYLYSIRATNAEYLSFYPNGKHAKEALKNITAYLEPLAAELKEKSAAAASSDISERAEFNRFLTELRQIISKMPDLDKAKSLQLIKQIGEDYK